LRILRFFRFYAWFGKTAPDAEAITACRILANLIPTLSFERIARETLKLLAAENPFPAWQLMIDGNIAQRFVAEASDIVRLQKLLENEKQSHEKTSALVRLTALLPQNMKIAGAVATRLKLSNRDTEQLTALATLPALLHGHLDPVPLRRLLYAHGTDNIRAAILLNGGNITDAFTVVAAWENPVFPIRGDDLVKQGVPVGPRIGNILHSVEEWWIANDFRPDHAACLAQAAQHGKNH
jgi:poly(A) polymerase